ncbi:MAG: sugar transferase [Acidobacteria bacterium]|nr:sugar transferase [Acidobacteriota bacterium]
MLRLFNVYIPTSVVALLVSEVALLSTCFLIANALMLNVDLGVLYLYDGAMTRQSLVILSIVVGMYFQDMYTQFRVRSRLILVQQICLAIGMAFLFQAVLNYVAPQMLVSRWVMLVGSLLSLIVMPVWRVIYSNEVTKAVAAQRILFIGANPVIMEIAAEIDRSPELGLRYAGFLSDDPIPELETLAPGAAILGTVAEVKSVVEKVKPERIVVGLTERRMRLPVNDLLDLRFSGVHIEQAGVLYEATFGRVSTRELRPSELIFSAELGPRPSSVQFQLVYSFLAGLIILILAAPIMVLVAILVKLTSPGPVFYKQTRMGVDDVPFTVMKFRSMRTDAEAKTGAVWATRNDPRVTPLGKWLRKLRLDELPQLFNVLKGDMSMVGPRPERPEFTRLLEEKIPFYRQRTCVKPGLTGWAQINHKYGDTIEDTIAKLEYDLYYIKNLSFALDMYIIFSTVKIVVLGRGAQ